MRTRKSLLIVLLCITGLGLALCQEENWSKTTTQHRTESTKGKDEPDYTDRTLEEEANSEQESTYDRSLTDTSTSNSYDAGFLSESAAYRNDRAIDEPR